MSKRVILYLAIAVVFLYLFGKWSERQGHENSESIARAEVSLRLHKSWASQQQRFRAASKKHVTAARLGTIRLIENAPTLALRVEIKAASDEWEAAFRAESLRADNAEARVARLEGNTAELLKVADCRLLGVGFLPRCPSRTVSFMLGAGTVLGLVLLKH